MLNPLTGQFYNLLVPAQRIRLVKGELQSVGGIESVMSARCSSTAVATVRLLDGETILFSADSRDILELENELQRMGVVRS